MIQYNELTVRIGDYAPHPKTNKMLEEADNKSVLFRFLMQENPEYQDDLENEGADFVDHYLFKKYLKEEDIDKDEWISELGASILYDEFHDWLLSRLDHQRNIVEEDEDSRFGKDFNKDKYILVISNDLVRNNSFDFDGALVIEQYLKSASLEEIKNRKFAFEQAGHACKIAKLQFI